MNIQPIVHDDCQHKKWFKFDNCNEYTCCQCGTGVQITGHSVFKPPYKVGDTLYIKETRQSAIIDDDIGYCYLAEMEKENLIYVDGDDEPIKWRPSIHMPEEAARSFIRITGVKVMRLQDIDDCSNLDKLGITLNNYNKNVLVMKIEFAGNWNKDNLRNPYSSNPWVWLYEYERVSKEDANA